MTHRRVHRVLLSCLVAVFGAVAVAACGDDGGGDVDLDFTADTVDGGTIDAADYEGTDVVFWFWAPWCTSCNQQAPAIAETIRDRMDVTIVGMSGQAELAAMTDFVDRHELHGIPHMIDPDGEIWSRFGPITRSAFVFLDDDGTATRTEFGVLTTEEINERIDQLLAE